MKLLISRFLCPFSRWFICRKHGFCVCLLNASERCNGQCKKIHKIYSNNHWLIMNFYLFPFIVAFIHCHCCDWIMWKIMLINSQSADTEKDFFLLLLLTLFCILLQKWNKTWNSKLNWTLLTWIARKFVCK